MSSWGKTRTRFGKSLCVAMMLCVFAFLNAPAPVDGQVGGNSQPPSITDTIAGKPAGDQTDVSSADQIQADQRRLAESYKLLEEKLFSLHEFEKDGNPTRSKLLERAFLQSQSKMTAAQMQLIVKLLTESKLKDAEKEQKIVLSELNELLNLLQSEDRGKRVRDEIQRHQEYLKEVERILRIQKGIRGQAEGGVDGRRLANSENKAADRTKNLADEIGQNEENGEQENELANPDQNPEQSDNPQSPPADDGADTAPTSEPKPADEKHAGKGASNKPSKNPDTNGPPKGTQPPSQPEANGQQGDQNPDAPPGAAPADPSPPSPQPPENPTRSRIQAAEQRMREAQEKLEQAQREDAIEAMKQAEREMALAKKELEEILRQLREEEIERTLAKLESRFRQMLEREVRVLESTQKLDRTVHQQRGTEFEINAGRLGSEQNSIATEAARALLLLQEDGSSVALPATVDEMHQDMLQTARRLSAAKVGRATIELEIDIVETLNYLVEALVESQQDFEKSKQNSQAGKPGKSGDKPLVDQLAEIKMLRGLQERIFRRHTRYSRFLEDPEDPIGGTDDPELKSALQRLAEKQAKLTEIARDIVNEKNK